MQTDFKTETFNVIETEDNIKKESFTQIQELVLS